MRAAALCVLLVSLLPEVATAQEPTATIDDLEAEARMRFRLARRYYETGRFADAAREFEGLHELTGLPRTLYNAYLAHREAGDLEAARRALVRYIPEAPAASRDAAIARLETLERLLARAAIEEIDAAREEPAPLADRPGDAEPDVGPDADVEGDHDGSDDTVDEGPDGDGGDADEVDASARVRAARALAPVAGTLAAVALGAGIGALSADAELDAMCEPRGCDDGFEDTQTRGRRLALTADVLAPLALGAALAAFVLWLRGDDDVDVAGTELRLRF